MARLIASSKCEEEDPEDKSNVQFLGQPGLACPTLPSPIIYVPPVAWATVAPGIYRSSYPIACNFSFLRRRARLRTILCLCPEIACHESKIWAVEQGIDLQLIRCMDNKEPFGGMSLGDVATALWLMEDKKRHPLLVHCATGRNRTGCIVACYRRIHGWSLTAIFEEYLRFAGSSASLMDMQFIELFTALPSADTTSLILKGGGLHVTEDP